MYITFSYLNWHRNGKLSKFEVQKKVHEKGAFYYVNHHNSDTFFGFQTLTARHFYAVEEGKSYIPQKKALLPIV